MDKSVNILMVMMVAHIHLVGCANGMPGGRRVSEWDSLDYRNISTQRRRDADDSYVMPSGGCVDDNLQDCR